MQRLLTRCTALVVLMVVLMVAGRGNGRAVAGTATPNVAGMWEGDWRHQIGSGQITLRLAQEGTKVIGKQSVVGVIPLFGEQRGRQLLLGEEVRDGQIMDSTLMFHVEAPDTPGGQVNCTLVTVIFSATWLHRRLETACHSTAGVAWGGTPMSKTPGLNRRRFCGAAAATVAAGLLGLLGFAERTKAMTDVAQQTGSDKTAIRPFHMNVPEGELTELRRRINATKWPERETVTDASQGV